MTDEPTTDAPSDAPAVPAPSKGTVVTYDSHDLQSGVTTTLYGLVVEVDDTHTSLLPLPSTLVVLPHDVVAAA